MKNTKFRKIICLEKTRKGRKQTMSSI